MVFPRSLSDCMSLQISKTLHGVRADLNNVVVWIVSIHPLGSSSSQFDFQAFEDRS